MTNIKPTLLECAVRAVEIGKGKLSRDYQDLRFEEAYDQAMKIKKIVSNCPDHYFLNGTLYSGRIPENGDD